MHLNYSSENQLNQQLIYNTNINNNKTNKSKTVFKLKLNTTILTIQLRQLH